MVTLGKCNFNDLFSCSCTQKVKMKMQFTETKLLAASFKTADTHIHMKWNSENAIPYKLVLCSGNHCQLIMPGIYLIVARMKSAEYTSSPYYQIIIQSPYSVFQLDSKTSSYNIQYLPYNQNVTEILSVE